MKKIVLIIAVALGFAAAASAQPKSIGLRFNGVYSNEISYQHYMGADFAEFDLGLYGNGFALTGVYDFSIAQPDWTPRGEWNFYAGPGVSVGTWAVEDKAGMRVGIVGQVGLDYTFWFPLQLSIDIRPSFDLVGDGALMSGFYPCISARYCF